MRHRFFSMTYALWFGCLTLSFASVSRARVVTPTPVPTCGEEPIGTLSYEPLMPQNAASPIPEPVPGDALGDYASPMAPLAPLSDPDSGMPSSLEFVSFFDEPLPPIKTKEVGICVQHATRTFVSFEVLTSTKGNPKETERFDRESTKVIRQPTWGTVEVDYVTGDIFYTPGHLRSPPDQGKEFTDFEIEFSTKEGVKSGPVKVRIVGIVA